LALDKITVHYPSDCSYCDIRIEGVSLLRPA
jgi:hypothetical protein